METGDQRPEPALFQFRECRRRECRFRFPASVISSDDARCPLCHDLAPVTTVPFLGRSPVRATNGQPGLVLEVLLDNIRSGYNVGSILRTCDGVGAGKVHLCGITATPGQAKVGKTALGADRVVPWSYYRNGVEAVRQLKRQGCSVWSLESTAKSQSIFEVNGRTLQGPVVLVVGNELSGVDPAILALSDRTVSVPMTGTKSSLNVAVAFGVAAYWLRYGTGQMVG